MKILLPIILAGISLLHCSPESIQESISGCEIEEGTLACFEMKTACELGYSEWTDLKAKDQIKCQCCENHK